MSTIRNINIIQIASQYGFNVELDDTFQEVVDKATTFLLEESAAPIFQLKATYVENVGQSTVVHWEDGNGYVYHGSGDYPETGVLETVIDTHGRIIEIVRPSTNKA